MRFPIFALAAACAFAQTSVETLWKELEAKRRALPGVQQQFDVQRTYILADKSRQERLHRLTIHMSGEMWREVFTSWGSEAHIFNGRELLHVDEGAGEFIRDRKPKPEESLPTLYNATSVDWSKATEVERRPCGYSRDNHSCVVLDLPVKPSVRFAGTSAARVVSGANRLMVDLDTGVIVAAHSAILWESESSRYVDESVYTVRQLRFDAPVDPAFFRLPASDPREVKKFSTWGAARIRKELKGKPAPPLTLKDMNGQTLSLADLQGKTVLLDFWASWCPPCRDDAGDLEKLQSRYGDRDMAIVGVNMAESRETVEKFLGEYPAHYANALTIENELPRIYQPAAIPTYVVIDPKGVIIAAEQGDQGFGSLRKMLKKAGLDVE